MVQGTERGEIVRAWLAVAAWTTLIALLSGDGFSSSSTSRYLEPFLRWLFPELGADRIAELHLAIRKIAHVTEYGVLALLAFRAVRTGAPAHRAPLHSAALALGLVFAVASADELHQTRTPHRGGAAHDVALDLGAGAAALAAARAIAGYIRERRRASGGVRSEPR